ncbi:MAG: threonine synthase [Planctomycetaceae bacterium]|jgi:threonine synthase|nr:threonine synthase [Planctomycetaceae bacterium]
MSEHAFQECINPQCAKTYAIDEIHHACPSCGELLDVSYDWDKLNVPKNLSDFEKYWSERNVPQRLSGVWRFHDLTPFAPLDQCVTVGEGQTLLQNAQGIAPFVGVNPANFYLQYEGLNPSGSFKDNGMAGAFTHGKLVGAKRAACASTGNTSASLAMYCAVTKLMKAVIFIGSGKIAYGKLSQALDYGAKTVQIDGDFDDAMARVQEVSKRLGIYLVNSVNPFRLEGQKSIMFRVLEQLRWNPPDWIVVPGGNLGNSSSFGKAFIELRQLGLIKKVPRIAIINAAGANTLYRLVEKDSLRWNGGNYDKTLVRKFYSDMTAEGRRASTIASAIEINRPVNLSKCLRALDFTRGVVREVSEQGILDAKAQIGAGGFGCEPASAASVAGAKRLVAEGVIGRDERVVCILTGHQLKDPNATVAYHGMDAELYEKYLKNRGVTETPYANRPISVANDLDKIVAAIEN